MQFLERSFVENAAYRPRPIIHFDPKENYVFVITPWGQENSSQDLVEKIQSYLTSSRMDQEHTSPFLPIKHYDRPANAIRNALLLANEYVFKSKNQSEFTTGFEIFVGVLEKDLFYFTNVGHPHTLLHRNNQTLLPIGFDFDHAMNFSRNKKLAPLPDKLLGVQESIDFQIQNIKVTDKDQFLLLSRSWISKDFLSLKAKDRKFDSYIKALSQDEGQPFWFGLIEF
jgi:hypothetical protein